jgi:hypothetical protein
MELDTRPNKLWIVKTNNRTRATFTTRQEAREYHKALRRIDPNSRIYYVQVLDQEVPVR